MEARERWIEGVEFPATKLKLIETAADAGAPQDLIDRLQQLTREQYASLEDVAAELSGA